MFGFSAKRVAKKYASSIKNNKFSLPITYEEYYEKSGFGRHLLLQLQYEGSDVGNISGILVESGDLSNYQCKSDLQVLSSKHPATNTNKGGVRILIVNESDLSESFRGVGLGIQMYTEFLRIYWDKVNKPFIFIPDACEVGRTSQDARRVWKSLARHKPSSNLCIAILERP